MLLSAFRLVNAIMLTVSAVLLLDGIRLLGLVLCSENASELSHAVLHVRPHVSRRVSLDRSERDSAEDRLWKEREQRIDSSLFKCLAKFFDPWMGLGQSVWWGEERRQDIANHSCATLVVKLHEKKTKITTSVDCVAMSSSEYLFAPLEITSQHYLRFVKFVEVLEQTS